MSKPGYRFSRPKTTTVDGELAGVEADSAQLSAMAALERRAALGAVTAAATHEIRNLATTIFASLALLERRAGDAEIAPSVLADAKISCDAIRELCVVMASYGGCGAMTPEPVELRAAVCRAMRLAELATAGQSVALRVEMPDKSLQVLAQPREFCQVVLNLLINASEAIAPGQEGLVWLRVFALDQTVRIDIEDNGLGISAEAQSRVFDEFYSTKADGAGLGLHLCRQLVHGWGGRIAVESVVGDGSRFSIFLASA